MNRKTLAAVIALAILTLQVLQYERAYASSADFNLQLGEAFTSDTSLLIYNVTAVAQNNSLGLGPAYLLNGLADNGYWYQVGVAYNWYPNLDSGRGFSLIYAVFAPNGSIIFPLNSNSAGLQRFNGTVKNGDLIQLTLDIEDGRIYMSAYDYNTGATSFISYLSYNATRFLGSLSKPINSKGYFTGLMTEQYFANSNISNPMFVSFTSKLEVNSSYMFIDLTDRSNNSVIFFNGKFVELNPYQPQELNWRNLTEFATSFGFFTGNSSGKSFTPPVLNSSNFPSQTSGSNQKITFINSVIPGCSQKEITLIHATNYGYYLFGSAYIAETDVGSHLQLCYFLPGSLANFTSSVVWLINSTAVQTQNIRSGIYNYTFIPLSEGTYLISVQVFDQQKTLRWYAMPIQIKVNAEPEIESITFSNVTGIVEVKVNGGTPPFTYTWYINNENFSVTSQPFLILPEGINPYYIHVIVRDSAGNFASSGYYSSHYLSSSILELMLLLVSIFFVSSFFAVFCEIGKRRILTKLRE